MTREQMVARALVYAAEADKLGLRNTERKFYEYAVQIMSEPRWLSFMRWAVA